MVPLFGHSWAQRLLTRQIARNSISHAYLITGPAQVGRRSLALWFVQALFCKEPPEAGIPCGLCVECGRVARMEHPDLHLMSVQDDAAAIKIDQIRELQPKLSLVPYQAPYRVALLTNFQKATIGAQNALLKTLEEAPARVILLVTADSPESVLPTIQSRCEVLRLRPMPVDALASALHDSPAADEDTAFLARVAGGRPGLALSLAQDEDLLALRRRWLDNLVHALKDDRIGRFKLAEQAAKDRASLRDGLELWSSFWRDVLLMKAGQDSALTNSDYADEIRQTASALTLEQCLHLLEDAEESLRGMDLNLNPRLLVEVLTLGWPYL